MPDYNFPYFKYNQYPLAWTNRLRGKPAIIIGGGPSVNKYKIFLEQNYKHFITFGVNRVFPKYIKIDSSFLLWQDDSLFEDRYDFTQMTQLRAIKFCRHGADHYQIPAFKYSVESKYIEPMTMLNLTGSGTSGHQACQLAYLFGCSPIVILGLDGHLSAKKDTNFYGDNHHYSDKIRAMKRHQRGIRWFLKFAKKKNLNVINISRNGMKWQDLSETELYDILYRPKISRHYIWKKLDMFNVQKGTERASAAMLRRISVK